MFKSKAKFEIAKLAVNDRNDPDAMINHAAWKVTMDADFEREGVKDVIDGTIVIPEKPDPVPTKSQINTLVRSQTITRAEIRAELKRIASLIKSHEKYENDVKMIKAKYDHVKSMLLHSLSPVLKVKLTNAVTSSDAKGLWDAIERYFNEDSGAAVTALQRELKDIVLDKKEKFDNLVSRIRFKNSQLEVYGNGLNDTLLKGTLVEAITAADDPALAQVILSSLPQMHLMTFDEFANFLTGNQSFIDKARETINKHSTQNVREHAAEQANFSATPNNYDRSNSRKGNDRSGRKALRRTKFLGKCNWCKQVGHMKKDCIQFKDHIKEHGKSKRSGRGKGKEKSKGRNVSSKFNHDEDDGEDSNDE